MIVGRLIPAGTGGATMRVRKLAHGRDQKGIEQRKAESERAAALAAPSETVLDDVIEIDADSGLVDTYESREG